MVTRACTAFERRASRGAEIHVIDAQLAAASSAQVRIDRWLAYVPAAGHLAKNKRYFIEYGPRSGGSAAISLFQDELTQHPGYPPFDPQVGCYAARELDGSKLWANSHRLFVHLGRRQPA